MKKILSLFAAAVVIVGCNNGNNSSNSGNFMVTSITPSNGSKIPTNPAFIAQFNNNVNLSTLSGIALVESGTNLPLTCSSSSANVVSCTPKQPLEYGNQYSLLFSSGVKNTAGNSLSPATYNYTTYFSPQIKSINPAPGNIPLSNTSFDVQFNESMSIATLNTSTTAGNVTFTDNTTSSSLPISCTSNDGINMACKLAESMIMNESYTLTLTNKILSQNGDPLVPAGFNYFATLNNYNWTISATLPNMNTAIQTDNDGGLHIVNTDYNNNMNLYTYSSDTWGNSIPNPPKNGDFTFANGLVVFGSNNNVYTVEKEPSSQHDIAIYNYNPTSGWKQLPSIGHQYWNTGAMTVMPNGLVYVVPMTNNLSCAFIEYINSAWTTLNCPADVSTQMQSVFLTNEDNNVYMLWGNGIFKYTGTWSNITFNAPVTGSASKLHLVNHQLYYTHIVANGSDIYELNTGTNSWESVVSIPSRISYITANSIYYADSKSKNLYRYDRSLSNSVNLTPVNLDLSPISSIYVDNNSNIFTTTSYGHVYQGTPQ